MEDIFEGRWPRGLKIGRDIVYLSKVGWITLFPCANQCDREGIDKVQSWVLDWGKTVMQREDNTQTQAYSSIIVFLPVYQQYFCHTGRCISFRKERGRQWLMLRVDNTQAWNWKQATITLLFSSAVFLSVKQLYSSQFNIYISIVWACVFLSGRREEKSNAEIRGQHTDWGGYSNMMDTTKRRETRVLKPKIIDT